MANMQGGRPFSLTWLQLLPRLTLKAHSQPRLSIVHTIAFDPISSRISLLAFTDPLGILRLAERPVLQRAPALQAWLEERTDEVRKI
jgi:hypothetical protein